MMMSAPSAARRRAILRPMRLAAPVIRATWPFREFSGIWNFSLSGEINILVGRAGMQGTESQKILHREEGGKAEVNRRERDNLPRRGGERPRRAEDEVDILASWGAACLRQAGPSIPHSGTSG